MRDEPPIKLQGDDKDEHGDNRESATAKDKERENARDGSYDSNLEIFRPKVSKDVLACHNT